MKNNISTQDTYPGQPKNIYDSLKWKEKQWIRFDTYLYLHPTDMTQCSVKTILTGGITDADGNPVGNGVIETKTIDLSSTNYLTKGKLDVSFIGNPAAWSAKQNELYLDDVKIYQQHADAQALTLDKTADVDPAGAEIGAKLVFDLDATTMTGADKVKVSDGTATFSPTAVTFDAMNPNKLTLTFGAGVLAGGKTYTVSFDESVKDLFGTSVTATATFTTKEGTITPPDPASATVTAAAIGAGSVSAGGSAPAASASATGKLGDEVTLTATAGAGKFLHWIDAATGRILSEDSVYKTVILGDTTLSAVFTSGAAEKIAVFKNGRSRQVVTSVFTDGTVVAPASPYVMGYEFTCWLKDGVPQTFGAGESVTIAEDTVFVAGYARSETAYDVVVENGSGSGKYRYNDAVTAVANAAEAGKKFSHWEKNGAVVSYDEKYEFYANGALTVRAVYVENSVTVEREPVLVMSGPVAVDGNKLAYFAERDVPAEWEILEAGILLGQSAALELGGAGVVKAAASSTEARGQYTVRKVAAPGETWYGRAYVAYREKGEVKVKYSEVVSGEM